MISVKTRRLPRPIGGAEDDALMRRPLGGPVDAGGLRVPGIRRAEAPSSEAALDLKSIALGPPTQGRAAPCVTNAAYRLRRARFSLGKHVFRGRLSTTAEPRACPKAFLPVYPTSW